MGELKEYRITWRHEVYIEAENEDEAYKKWLGGELGHLDREVEEGRFADHNYVQRISFEDENYNEIQRQ